MEYSVASLSGTMNKSKQRTTPSYKVMIAVLALMCGCGNAQSIQGTRTSMLMEIDGAALMLTSTGQGAGGNPSGGPVTVASLADVHNATEIIIALMQPQIANINVQIGNVSDNLINSNENLSDERARAITAEATETLRALTAEANISSSIANISSSVDKEILRATIAENAEHVRATIAENAEHARATIA